MPPNMPPFALKTARYYGKYFIHKDIRDMILIIKDCINSSIDFLSTTL